MVAGGLVCGGGLGAGASGRRGLGDGSELGGGYGVRVVAAADLVAAGE